MVADFPKVNITNRIRTGKFRFDRKHLISAVIKQVQKGRPAIPKIFYNFVYKHSSVSVYSCYYSSHSKHLKEELKCNAFSLGWLNVYGKYYSAQVPPLK